MLKNFENPIPENKMKTTIDTTFREALTSMKADPTVRCKRSGWDYDISRHHIEENDFVTEPFLIVAAGDDGYGVWTPTNADLFANDWIIETIKYKGDKMLKNLKTPNTPILQGNLSGYYWIQGSIIYKGTKARVHFHRGKGLPDLSKVEGIKELLFTSAARQIIEANEESGYGPSQMTNLEYFFTKEEVASIIMDAYPDDIDITIRYVLTNSLDENHTSIPVLDFYGPPKPGNYAPMGPSGSDKYIQTVKWL